MRIDVGCGLGRWDATRKDVVTSYRSHFRRSSGRCATEPVPLCSFPEANSCTPATGRIAGAPYPQAVIRLLSRSSTLGFERGFWLGSWHWQLYVKSIRRAE